MQMLGMAAARCPRTLCAAPLSVVMLMHAVTGALAQYGADGASGSYGTPRPAVECSGGCVGTFEKCAGSNGNPDNSINIATQLPCCSSADQCVFKSMFFSQCRPKPQGIPADWPNGRVLEDCTTTTTTSGRPLKPPPDYIAAINEHVDFTATGFFASGFDKIPFPEIYADFDDAFGADFVADSAILVTPVLNKLLTDIGLPADAAAELAEEGGVEFATTLYDILRLGPNDEPSDSAAQGAQRRLLFLGGVVRWVKKAAKAVKDVVVDAANTVKEEVLDPLVELGEEAATEVGCSIFAGGTLPAYLAAHAYFAAQAVFFNQPQPMPDRFKYFAHLFHGDLVDGPWTTVTGGGIPLLWGVVFDADFPGDSPFGRGPWRDQAVTMPGTVFIPLPAHDLVATNSSYSDIVTVGRALVHELEHIKQYLQRQNSPGWFGWEYLREWCLAGFSYRGNTFEQSAYAIEEEGFPLYFSTADYFRCWDLRNLAGTIGFPIAMAPVKVTDEQFPGRNTESLAFERGAISMSRQFLNNCKSRCERPGQLVGRLPLPFVPLEECYQACALETCTVVA